MQSTAAPLLTPNPLPATAVPASLPAAGYSGGRGGVAAETVNTTPSLPNEMQQASLLDLVNVVFMNMVRGSQGRT